MGDVYMVNGKILSGLPNHAKDIIFDNDGTTLNSTNTEDAIKEVNSNLASGTTFAELKAIVDNMTDKQYMNSVLILDNDNVYHPSDLSTKSYMGIFYNSDNSVLFDYVKITPNTTTINWRRKMLNGSTNTISYTFNSWKLLHQGTIS